MIRSEMPYPLSGSRAFERKTGRRVTIIRQNSDGSFFVRRDDEPGPRWNRGGRASGNTTLAADDIVETAEETGVGSYESTRTLAGKPRVSRKARRALKQRGSSANKKSAASEMAGAQ